MLQAAGSVTFFASFHLSSGYLVAWYQDGVSVGTSDVLQGFRQVPTPVFVSDVAKHNKNVLLHNKEERILQTEELH